MIIENNTQSYAPLTNSNASKSKGRLSTTNGLQPVIQKSELNSFTKDSKGSSKQGIREKLAN